MQDDILNLLKSIGINQSKITPNLIKKMSEMINNKNFQMDDMVDIIKTLGISIPDQYTEEQLNNINQNAYQVKNKIKIGRNQKCPCKSGKKYKLCCLIKKK